MTFVLPTTISIGSLLFIRASGIRPAIREDSMAKKGKKRIDQLPVLHPDAAGIDVGASELFVAVGADRDPQPVRSFPTFTRDLNALGLATAVRDSFRRNGVHQRVLDSGVSNSGIARARSVSCQR